MPPPLFPTDTAQYIGARLRATAEPSPADYRILALRALLQRWRREDTTLTPAQNTWLIRHLKNCFWHPTPEQWTRLAPRFLVWCGEVGLVPGQVAKLYDDNST